MCPCKVSLVGNHLESIGFQHKIDIMWPLTPICVQFCFLSMPLSSQTGFLFTSVKVVTSSSRGRPCKVVEVSTSKTGSTVTPKVNLFEVPVALSILNIRRTELGTWSWIVTTLQKLWAKRDREIAEERDWFPSKGEPKVMQMRRNDGGEG